MVKDYGQFEGGVVWLEDGRREAWDLQAFRGILTALDMTRTG